VPGGLIIILNFPHFNLHCPPLTEPVTPDSYVVNWTPESWAMLAFATVVGFAIPLIILKRRENKPS
jgi:hypothetical protein